MRTVDDVERLLSLQERKYGLCHAKLASTLETLAELLSLEGRYKEAEQLYWRVFEIRQETMGQSLDVAATLLELAYLNARQENRVEAEHLFRRVCEIYKKLCGANSQQYIDTRSALSEFLGEELEKDVEITIPTRETGQRAQDFPWTERFNHGVDLLDRGEFTSAEDFFSCLVLVAEHFAPETIHHGRSVDHLARVYLFQERFRDSLKYFEQALALFENVAGGEDKDTVECLEGTGDAHAGLEEYEQSRFVYRWALSVAERQSFVEPAERINSKLAMLPFRVSNPVGNEEKVPSSADAVPAKTETAAVQLQPTPEQATGVPGGMKALLATVGPPAKRKTGTVSKSSVMTANVASSSEVTANPVLSKTSDLASTPEPATTKRKSSTHKVSTMASISASEATPILNPPIPGATDHSPPQVVPESSAKTGKRKTGTVKNVAAGETSSSPAMPATTERTPFQAAFGQPAQTVSLDDMLKDLGTRRKKTTSTLIKPSFGTTSGAVSDPIVAKPHTPEADERVVSIANWQKQRESAKEFFRQRNYQEAERKAIVTLEIADELFPPCDHRLWHAYCQVASISQATGKLVQAVHLYRTVLNMCEKSLGKAHPDNAKILEQLGALYMLQDRLNDAEDCYQQAIKILSKHDEGEMADAVSKLSIIKKRRERWTQ